MTNTTCMHQPALLYNMCTQVCRLQRDVTAHLGVVGVAAAAGGQVQQRMALAGVRAVLAQQPQQRLARHARQVAPPLQSMMLWRMSGDIVHHLNLLSSNV